MLSVAYKTSCFFELFEKLEPQTDLERLTKIDKKKYQMLKKCRVRLVSINSQPLDPHPSHYSLVVAILTKPGGKQNTQQECFVSVMPLFIFRTSRHQIIIIIPQVACIRNSVKMFREMSMVHL